MHVVARCNNREFYFAAPEDFEILLDHLGEMGSAYGVRLFAYGAWGQAKGVRYLRRWGRSEENGGHLRNK
jgi:hypothetical protein